MLASARTHGGQKERVLDVLDLCRSSVVPASSPNGHAEFTEHATGQQSETGLSASMNLQMFGKDMSVRAVNSCIEYTSSAWHSGV